MSAASPMRTLDVRPLTHEAFAPFGTVIDCDAGTPLLINGGTAQRFDRLAEVGFNAPARGVGISIFVAGARTLPMRIEQLERHPLGAQAFMPLGGHDYLVIVADDRDGRPVAPRAFHARADQGVCFGIGVWHHPLIALHDHSRFIVIDAITDDDNLMLAEPFGARFLLGAFAPP
ncbi:MAG: ureidoglycolate lyase [Burkholderiaceae bacterium]